MLLSIFLWIDTFEGKQPWCLVMAATLKQSPPPTLYTLHTLHRSFTQPTLISTLGITGNTDWHHWQLCLLCIFALAKLKLSLLFSYNV